MFETEIPGVGRRGLELGGDARVVVVVYHDGRCELFSRAGPDADGEKLLNLTSEQADKLGSILEGAYFESVDVDELSVPLGGAIIEWVELTADSPLVGATLRESGLRSETGVAIMAIQRGEETIPNPGPETELRQGDLLVAVGTREEHAALQTFVESGE